MMLATQEWKRETLDFSEWTDVARSAEYMAFQLAMHILRSSLVWYIYEQRALKLRYERDAHEYRLREVVMRVRVYEAQGRYRKGSNAGEPMTRLDCLRAVARDMSLTLEQVGDALREADTMWLAEN